MSKNLIETKILVLRSQAQDALRRAKKAHERALNGQKRLAKFSILSRAFSRRFSSVKERIREYEAKRFMCTAAAMHCARSIKFLERRLAMLRKNENA
jgi:hypothetical protein